MSQARLQQHWSSCLSLNQRLAETFFFLFHGTGTREQTKVWKNIQSCHVTSDDQVTILQNIHKYIIKLCINGQNSILPWKWGESVQFSSVQSLSRVRLFETPWIAAHQASLSITNSQVHPYLCPLSWWCHPAISSLLSPSPPAFNLSQHQSLLKWVSSSHQVAKVLEFQHQHQSSNEYLGLISFRMDWLDLLAVQGTLKNLLQHHTSKASILRCSAFFMVQLSHPYMTAGKTIAITRRTFVGKVMSLLLNMLSRLFITSLPRSKRLLISWLQSPSAVILEPLK